MGPGSNTYELTFATGQEPPVNGFWSLTMYNEHHFFHPNALKRYSLGTKNKTLKRNADGSLTLYAGAKSPGADKESNWLPAPDGTFSLCLLGQAGHPGRFVEAAGDPEDGVRLSPRRCISMRRRSSDRLRTLDASLLFCSPRFIHRSRTRLG